MVLLSSQDTKGDDAWERTAPSLPLAMLSNLGPEAALLGVIGLQSLLCTQEIFLPFFLCVCQILSFSIHCALLFLSPPIPYPQFPLSLQIPATK